MSIATQPDTISENHQSGQAVAKQNPLGHSPKTSPAVRRHLPPTHKDYWKPRLEHRCYTRDGKLVELPEYSVRFQHLGQRASFALGSSDADKAAATARDIYIFLKANGWEATNDKFKPKAVSQNKLTVGEFLSTVRETSGLRLRTFMNYDNCFRSILAGVFRIKDNADKFDYRTGGNKKWRERLDSIRLEKLTSHGVESWMKKFVAAVGSSPTAMASAKRTANTYVRCARSLFSEKLLKHPAVRKLTLPNPLPFHGVELFDAGSSKYISKINVQTLIAAAKRDLKLKDPEAYKAFLLGLFPGMRKGEIDLCEWQMVDWVNNSIKLEETQYLHLKTGDSAAEIHVDAEVMAELREFMPRAKSPFIISSVVTWGNGKTKRVHTRQPRNDSKRPYYRCAPVFKRLGAWLKSKGVKANKPLHELRKEIGALIATEHGIFAASRFLRHSDITTTARHYAEHKTRISVGLGKLLNTTPKALPGPAQAEV